jgi:hypothetical protein
MQREPGAVIVHGSWYSGFHAWVEVERDGLIFRIDRTGEWHELTHRIRFGAQEEARYTLTEACKKQMETGHHGPWHEVGEDREMAQRDLERRMAQAKLERIAAEESA